MTADREASVRRSGRPASPQTERERRARAGPVSGAVNSVRRNAPDCLTPLADYTAAQAAPPPPPLRRCAGPLQAPCAAGQAALPSLGGRCASAAPLGP